VIFDGVEVKRKQSPPDARLGGARKTEYSECCSSHVRLSAVVPAVGMTGHPFAVWGLAGRPR
jgi:hypothetical protein